MNKNLTQVETKSLQINKNKRRSYDINFKIMVAIDAEKTNNVQAAKKYSVSEKNIRLWRKNVSTYKKTNSARKAFRGPKKGRFVQIDQEVYNFVIQKRNEGLPISREVMKIKALEIAKDLKISKEEFKASIGWCRRMMKRTGLSLRRRTSLAQRLPAEFEEKLVAYQSYIIDLRRKYNYTLGQMCNADQTPVYFDMPSNVTAKGLNWCY